MRQDRQSLVLDREYLPLVEFRYPTLVTKNDPIDTDKCEYYGLNFPRFRCTIWYTHVHHRKNS